MLPKIYSKVLKLNKLRLELSHQKFLKNLFESSKSLDKSVTLLDKDIIRIEEKIKSMENDNDIKKITNK